MQDKELFKVEGHIIDVLPGTTFKVGLTNGGEIICHLSGKMRKNNIRVLLGDRIEAEMSVYDLTKGRITYRFK